ncbi:MAG: hypothetical protein JO029_04650 [Candidatus Eremiobacteraeota bacterium]|nr:hypothetical protein [Candidatus Eremiobacteraeota bacterium]MBV8283952.1 hypothetical protein [Candidatus Eremiobacteraeota bacterium]MBV8332930.1 hypothetical protein [Candidatus Eremiobacteraeota bacterium]MBV8433554.1 hypothetical protein [Candidatus Eremiobacteraeota bacterium]MBV8583572.1 hypothetical protein [Candidatus Eremiobacteraeota bacterium]
MSFVPFSRLATIVMAGVVCFGLIVPLATMRHQMVVAIGVVVLFVTYVAINIVLWQRMRT